MVVPIREVRLPRTSSVAKASAENETTALPGLSQVQRVLLVGGSHFKQNLRANILRGHGLQVDVAGTLAEGRSRSQVASYGWILLDAHGQLPGEVINFCKQIEQTTPQPRIAFFVGPPTYVSLRWPGEDIVEESEKNGESRLLERVPSLGDKSPLTIHHQPCSKHKSPQQQKVG